ncbi:thiol reductant ABC exporter subunit CydD [Ktedonobacter racemifer]|uniref:ABC transporter, CydDC cysteine exporter (CydDC-E) family, permease/ATP-binding protein CydD n=1 Tax=Ktedonobacter racemifer DSM 44963 TaxID=485913 RepID=D6U504_KTERA|nr:thiol reductant ABC exporter subunit CydD [Ktedonobacter racemifer]EFH81584.1 ABC transporter, CydDC cysteine exporter (CydDC-E) family, permease/ATP-binding protein CydD [Ktedonobacter racemifer DSM 44963]
MKIYRRLFRYTPQVQLYLACTIGIALLTGLLIVAQSYGITQVIQHIFLDKQTLAQVTSLLLVLAAVMLGRALLPWFGEFIAGYTASKAKTSIRERVMKRLFALGPAYTSGERSGEMANTLTEGIEALDAFFSQLLPQMIITMLVPVIILITVFACDFLSGIVLLVTLPVLPIFMILIGKAADAMTKKQWRLMNQMSAHFLDVLQGLTTLKLFDRSRAQSEIIERISERYRVMTMKVLRIAFLSAFVMELGATISVALVAVEIGLRLLYGLMPFDKAFLILLLAPEYFQPLRTIGTRFHASMNSTAAAERIFDILDTPLPEQKPATTEPLPSPETLRFEDVSFSYRQEGEEPRRALVDVSFTARRGQKIAIVGPSGAGKSTLASLLLRFMELESGQILVNETPLERFSVQQWRRQVAWIPQRPYLFDASIAENIRFGRQDASMEEVIQAAKQAGIHDFIQGLPQGYETPIGERGARLSGGQIQRLSLARAFLKQAPILLLDEATANLDSQHEERILDELSALTQDHILFIIAHRLNTVRQANRILVLDEGRLVEEGTHHELVEQNGLYRELLAAYRRDEKEVEA